MNSSISSPAATGASDGAENMHAAALNASVMPTGHGNRIRSALFWTACAALPILMLCAVSA